MSWLPYLSMERQQLVLRGAAVLRWAIALAWSFGFVAVVSGMVRLPRSSGSWMGAFVASLFAIGLLSAWMGWQRERNVREAPIPQFLKRKLRDQFPGLSAKDCDLVERGLRQYFLA